MPRSRYGYQKGMEEDRLGKSIGAKLARSLIAEAGSGRSPELEGAHGPNSRHQVHTLADGRIVDVFFKSARLYGSREDFLQDQGPRS